MHERRKNFRYQLSCAQQVTFFDVVMRFDGQGHICGAKR